jgi:hypothetical protein
VTALLALSGLGCIGFAGALIDYNLARDIEDPLDYSVAAIALVVGAVDLLLVVLACV